jgi:hypothetical protein
MGVRADEVNALGFTLKETQLNQRTVTKALQAIAEMLGVETDVFSIQTKDAAPYSRRDYRSVKFDNHGNLQVFGETDQIASVHTGTRHVPREVHNVSTGYVNPSDSQIYYLCWPKDMSLELAAVAKAAQQAGLQIAA